MLCAIAKFEHDPSMLVCSRTSVLVTKVESGNIVRSGFPRTQYVRTDQMPCVRPCGANIQTSLIEGWWKICRGGTGWRCFYHSKRPHCKNGQGTVDSDLHGKRVNSTMLVYRISNDAVLAMLCNMEKGLLENLVWFLAKADEPKLTLNA